MKFDKKIAIDVQNVSKRFKLFSSPKERLIQALHPLRKQYFKEFWALKGISFQVQKGEILGIMGKNGSGKSTLLQIICSIMKATKGEIKVRGSISALLELGAGFNPEYTGREIVILNGAILGFTHNEMIKKLPQIESFADIGEFFDQPTKTYSTGMFVRVAFAAAIHVDPEILIVDEALSVGDARFQHRCFQRIRDIMEQGRTILVVSHSTETLLRICHRGIVLDEGELKHVGTIKSAVNCYQNILYGPNKVKESSGGHQEVEPNRDNEDNLLISRIMQNSGGRDKVHEKPYYNRHEIRLGDGGVKIIDFDLVVDGEINPVEIKKHKDVKLVIKLYSYEEFEGVSIGFAIVTVDGTYIFGTNFDMMDEPFFSLKKGESKTVIFKWKSHIAGGDYFLNIGCHRYVNGDQRFLDIRRSVAKLKFENTPESIGFVDLEINSEVITANL